MINFDSLQSLSFRISMDIGDTSKQIEIPFQCNEEQSQKHQQSITLFFFFLNFPQAFLVSTVIRTTLSFGFSQAKK